MHPRVSVACRRVSTYGVAEVLRGGVVENHAIDAVEEVANVVKGDSVSEVLQYVQHNPEHMVERVTRHASSVKPIEPCAKVASKTSRYAT